MEYVMQYTIGHLVSSNSEAREGRSEEAIERVLDSLLRTGGCGLR